MFLTSWLLRIRPRIGPLRAQGLLFADSRQRDGRASPASLPDGSYHYALSPLRLVERTFQVLPWPEGRDSTGGILNYLAGSHIFDFSGFARSDTKDPEARKSYFLTRSESIPDNFAF